MAKKPKFEEMSPMERREFLFLANSVFALPFIPKDIASKCLSVLVPQAHAQTTPRFFLEVNFRDQWDFGHVFLAPSLARQADNLRSQRSLAYFDQQSDLTQGPNNLWVTQQGRPLLPHLNDIAVMELGESCIGNIHGHESGNGMRSPGRGYNRRPGTIDMATIDSRPGGRVGGNEVLYSSSPTPAILHNYYAKQNGASRNGIIFRSSIRSIHTYYHFEANLQNAQMDRYFDKQTLLSAFENVGTPSPSQTIIERHGNTLAQLIKYVDAQFFARKPALSNQRTNHEALVDEWGNLVAQPPQSLSLNLSAQEINYWTQGVPEQKSCPGDSAQNCTDASGKTNLGEIFGWASKLFIGNAVKTIAIDYDFHDVHGDRNRLVLETQAHCTTLPLTRLIESLKAAGIWDQTTIAMYTLDGSRGPNRSSTGYGTKNAVILAGGNIRGGYYGDINYNNGWVWRRPDDNGNPTVGTTDGFSQRVPDADVYKTVARASGVSDSLVNSFADVASGRVLSYMLE